MTVPEKKTQRVLDRTMTDDFLISPPPPPPPPPPPLPPVEKVIVNPVAPSKTVTKKPSSATMNTPPSVTSYSVASLQQHTNSFSEENFIRDGRLGKLFLAKLPDGKV